MAKHKDPNHLTPKQVKAREKVMSQLKSSLETTYEGRDKLIKEVRELRYMERKVHIPAAYGQTAVEIRTPLMNDLIQRLAGALSVNLPHIKVPPRPN